MLKRILVTAALAVSTLTVGAASAGAADSPCTAPAQTASVPDNIAKHNGKRKCYWKDKYGQWCKFCYKYGDYQLEYCKDRGD
ncbi:hypothetical protein [Sinosporangium siamense]|uniref:Uncharacterized protein n=1 Tax=Sinosporangium siamense TaxID=1367973 RepID=A0A919VC88_9ACTN|nr:hypothetical protein [Sinosporangium siamense]GII97352.1 hypothetical protein Ssi02_75830 [Sinosporangium siamense]